jgi:hypothetical protein
MKKHKQIGRYFLFILFVIASATFSCNKDDIPPKQLIIFQYHYSNYAWGVQSFGWFIDREGKVKSYNLPVKWNIPDSLGFITSEALEENYSLASQLVYEVRSNELENKFQAVIKLDNNSLSEESPKAFDAGIASFYCYLWRPEKSMYERVLLASTGDWEQYNTDPEAKKVVVWLINLGNHLDDFFWLY